MTAQDFRDLMRKRPFVPFRVVMSSGKSYEIRHPEMGLVLKNDVVVGVDVGEDDMPAGFRFCPLFHVATVESLSASESGGSKGGM